MPEIRIGCSGFSYDHWRGNFYPLELPQSKWLDYYCSRFGSVELNVTFYRLLKPETFQHWRERTPPGFTFSVKGSRYITHILRLTDPDEALKRFFEGVLMLEQKLVAVLWQFPPGMTVDAGRLAAFLEALKPYPARHALEFRNQSWLNDRVRELCIKHGAALCMADWPPFIDTTPATADFVYIRRHGHSGSYDGCYSGEALAADAQRIRTWLNAGQDVLIYFNNDIHGYAPRNALVLEGMLKES